MTAVRLHYKMSTKLHVTGLLLILALPCGAVAEYDGQYLDGLIKEAVANNPGIQAVYSAYSAAQTHTPVLRRMPDPLLGIEIVGSMRMYSITQQIPFPLKLDNHARIEQAQAQEIAYMYEEKKRAVVTEIKKTYAQLFLFSKGIETVEKSIVYLEQIFHIASTQYAVGAAVQSHVLKAQVELARAEDQLLVLEENLTVAKARLNTLLNRPVHAELIVPQSLDTTLDMLSSDSLYVLARTSRPLLKAAELRQEEAEVMKIMAGQMYIPDFVFKITQRESDAVLTDRAYMVGITLPVWFFGKQNVMLTEARINLEKFRQQYEAVENEILLQIQEALIAIKSHMRTIKLYETSIIPQSDANVRSALAAYETNAIDFFYLLDSEKTRIQTDLEYYRAQTELYMSIADLERTVGIDLQRHSNEEVK